MTPSQTFVFELFFKVKQFERLVKALNSSVLCSLVFTASQVANSILKSVTLPTLSVLLTCDHSTQVALRGLSILGEVAFERLTSAVNGRISNLVQIPLSKVSVTETGINHRLTSLVGCVS